MSCCMAPGPVCQLPDTTLLLLLLLLPLLLLLLLPLLLLLLLPLLLLPLLLLLLLLLCTSWTARSCSCSWMTPLLVRSGGWSRDPRMTQP
jgi:hypothetical protein